MLAGGSGFLGQALAKVLLARGVDVVVLTRRPKAQRNDGARQVSWAPATFPASSNPISYPLPILEARAGAKELVAAEAWAAALEGAAALVNFAGCSVNCVHHAENQRAILRTRVDSVRALGAAVRACRQPPAVWVQCSATGYYGDVRDRVCSETSAVGRGFMAEVCRAWEAAFAEQELTASRKVMLRIGVVLGRRGGAYPALRRLTRFFLGGPAGSGDQGVSWIHVDDLTGMIAEAIANAEWRGVYNVCAPEPVTNAEFMRALREVQRRPWAPSAPALAVRFVARWLLRSEGRLILEGPRVVPQRALAAGYRFKYEKLAAALAALAER